ncbi:MAG: DNA-binding GntR family transcriptional regulator [Planctomycetota bacterium]|jgi:DNA-binding GntR family transcriptional regulator
MHSTLAEKAYFYIREKLSRGELLPGTRLVNRTLAAEIGVSFTPVREAINQLASEGLVEYIRGAGAYVRRIDRTELSQLYDLRATLEPFAAAEAARNITSHQMEEMYRLCDLFHTLASGLRGEQDDKTHLDLWTRWLDAEESFHGLIFRAAANTWLVKIATELRLMSMLFGPQRMGQQVLTLSNASRSWREHARLASTLGRGDSEHAHLWMVQHIATGRTQVLAWYDEMERSGGLS